MAAMSGPCPFPPLEGDGAPHEDSLFYSDPPRQDIPINTSSGSAYPLNDASKVHRGSSVSSIATKEPEKQVEPGMEIGTKDLYREDYRCPWDEWAPDDVGINAEAAVGWMKFALIVRREKREADQSYLALHSITVQSPLIKDRLGVVFDSYRGVSTSLKKLTFNAPFHDFFYRWDRFENIVQGEKDELVSKHMGLLYDVLSPEIKPHIERTQDLLVNDVITYDYLWALFEPDTEVYTVTDDHERLYSLINSSYKQVSQNKTIFSISCRYIDCDGTNFGYASNTLAIGQFDDVKPIPELPVLPSHLHPDIKAIRAKLSERGRKFEQLNGFHYKSYSGLCIMNQNPFGGPNKRNLDDGRIVIDAKTHAAYNPDRAPRLQALDAAPAPPAPTTPGPFDGPFFAFDAGIGSAAAADDDDAMAFAGPLYRTMMPVVTRPPPRRRPALAAQQSCTGGSIALGENQHALCTPLLRGYCLSAKQWAQFYVDDVRDIRWNEEAFRRLVLPLDYKKVIWAFVDSQLALAADVVDDGLPFDDVVEGKGKGIIMLLSGEPGVGKTLTAESVAEEMRRPLYSLSAGELGNAADEVEENLHRVLEVSTKWGAVLLLDECDVFLEKRSTADIQRNKLVSVFLRLLEYYKGVMFLTTNRVAAFDPAFESRIHLTIDYPKLDLPSRLHVWKTFVRPSDEGSRYASSITEEQLESLAAADMNGRQIKNVVKTARLLAAREKRMLALEDVEIVLRVKRGSPSGVRDGEFR
ncbi:ATPase family AAA domain-containing protein 3B [Diplodia seriata]|uniref:ATPase family AAA domain-containing protein 3B n=1 Tax=Diplodia seriata TaxID=420778 RepID=A0A1S8BCV1_9PEZI|nr:ATPase family AAA domain-containing protein 3B [Diplodia seriata]